MKTNPPSRPDHDSSLRPRPSPERRKPPPELDPDARRRAVASMDAWLRDRYERARDALAKSACDGARTRYAVARIVVEVKERERAYGDGAVALLATGLGNDAKTLYHWAKVAETWNEEAFEAILARRNGVGEPITWSHLVELATLPEPERGDWLSRALATHPPEEQAAVIESAGFHVRGHKKRQKPELEALMGPGGIVILRAQAAKAGQHAGYEWQMSADGGKTWTSIPMTTIADTTVSGLPAGQTFMFRVRITVGRTTRDWSQPVSLLVH